MRVSSPRSELPRKRHVDQQIPHDPKVRITFVRDRIDGKDVNRWLCVTEKKTGRVLRLVELEPIPVQ
jgi:hypothetical protein